MATHTNRFEDLDCWKIARELVKFAYLCCRKGLLAKDWSSQDQFKRAAVSIMNNIAEGYGRFSDKDKLRFFDNAKASANEVKSMTYVFEDTELLPVEDCISLRKHADHAANLVGGYIRYIVNKNPNVKTD